MISITSFYTAGVKMPIILKRSFKRIKCSFCQLKENSDSNRASQSVREIMFYCILYSGNFAGLCLWETTLCKQSVKEVEG